MFLEVIPQRGETWREREVTRYSKTAWIEIQPEPFSSCLENIKSTLCGTFSKKPAVGKVIIDIGCLLAGRSTCI